MSWASPYVDRLLRGETVKFRPTGHSMAGRIESGQLVTVEPVTDLAAIGVGDIVLCRVGGATYLHLVKAIRPGPRFQIGNNRGHINGWTARIFGRCIAVEP